MASDLLQRFPQPINKNVASAAARCSNNNTTKNQETYKTPKKRLTMLSPSSTMNYPGEWPPNELGLPFCRNEFLRLANTKYIASAWYDDVSNCSWNGCAANNKASRRQLSWIKFGFYATSMAVITRFCLPLLQFSISSIPIAVRPLVTSVLLQPNLRCNKSH